VITGGESGRVGGTEMLQPLRPAVFLDKDGTLIEDEPYNVDCSKVRLTPGAGEATGLLAAAGYAIVVVTNQAGIAFGYFDAPALERVADKIRALLSPYGTQLAGFYCCPHLPDDCLLPGIAACDCRKPKAGMLFRAALELEIDLQRSWMVGDILDDVEAGRRAGCATVLLNAGGETEWRRGPLRCPDTVVPDLLSAASFILAGRGPARKPSLSEAR
jgi:D-glycero-D-manno-heptose 1,7-bisphosphate phosphatase